MNAMIEKVDNTIRKALFFKKVLWILYGGVLFIVENFYLRCILALAVIFCFIFISRNERKMLRILKMNLLNSEYITPNSKIHYTVQEKDRMWVNVTVMIKVDRTKKARFFSYDERLFFQLSGYPLFVADIIYNLKESNNELIISKEGKPLSKTDIAKLCTDIIATKKTQHFTYIRDEDISKQIILKRDRMHIFCKKNDLDFVRIILEKN